MTRLAKAGALAFGLWGLLHLAGGVAILLALRSGPQAGYSFYRFSDGIASPLAGAVLGYLAFLLVCAGLAACGIAVALNRKNSPDGLAANTAVTGLTEFGMVLFLLLPGYVSLLEALPGLLLLAVAVTAGGIACRNVHFRPVSVKE